MKLFNLNFWNVFTNIIALIFAIPIILIFLSLFNGFNENFEHIYEVVLLEYSINSIVLVIGVSLVVLFIGVSTALLVSSFKFTGSKIFEWALILPLAIPPYLLAYVMTEIFEYSGSANMILRSINFISDNGSLPSIRSLTGAIFIFGFALYPYVYLITRVALMNISKPILESARVLGTNKLNSYIKIVLPIIRPAIFAGLALVCMETLSDFGAVQHFAIPTFTTGIFRTWLGMYDLTTAMQLASILLFVIILFIFLERNHRANAQFSLASDTKEQVKLESLSGLKNILALLICLIPILVGFIIPVLEIISWSIEIENIFSTRFISASLNTMLLAIAAGIITTIIGIIFNFNIRISSSKNAGLVNNFISSGYGIPGLILAIGITQFLTIFDLILIETGIVITGSLFGLIFAYVVKSYALTNNVLESNYKQFSRSIDDSARTLGSSKYNLLKDIHLPLLRTGIFTSVLLVISEVVKELPATLILRPFNFDTLAVTVYTFASEERIYEAAFPSLFIIGIGLIPIYFISNMIKSARGLN
tara:strand:+ start:746 stop:2350 length:1605 start_codon:yes stop_codon:yes gene_type:complete